MAILSAEENWEDRGGGGDSQANADWTRSFRVFATSFREPEHRIVAACGIAFGDPHPSDRRARMKRFSVRQDRQFPGRWSVVFSYDRLTEQQDPADAQENPVNRPPLWRYSTTKVERAVEKDADGKPVVNSAKDPFIPPLTIEAGLLQFTVSFNRKDFDPEAAAKLIGKTNDAKWGRFGKGTAKMDEATGEEVWENGLTYYQISYTGTIRPGGWELEVMDRGLRKLIPKAGDVAEHHEVIRNKGVPVPAPVPLDGEGAPLAAGKDPVFLKFKVAPGAKFPPV